MGKIPRWKIVLDEEKNAGCAVVATRRCASSCVERDLGLEKTTPLSSQVRKSKILSASPNQNGVLYHQRNCGEMRGCHA